jgi:DNA-binding response OmpR family regulator
VTSVLICAPDPLADDLHGTLLWRDDVERHLASRFEDALTIAVAAHPDLVAIDRDFAGAERLVADLRDDPKTRECSIVVIARGEFQTDEVAFLQAGANAVLRLPPDADWDERLGALVRVPSRRATRLPVQLEFEARSAPRVLSAWGTVVNLSATGMLLETEAELAIGVDIDFRLRLTDGGAPVSGSGHIVRQAGAHRYGVRFYGLEGDGRERVLRFTEI